MAVKVIPMFPYEISCKNCEEKLLVETPLDLMVYGKPETRKARVKCPTCGETTDLPAGDQKRAIAKYDTERAWAR